MMYPKLTNESGALELAAEIRSGDLSPLEAVEAAIARVETLDGAINAVPVRDFDRARENAKALDGKTASADQPLFGVPMTIKESFDIAGLPTTWGHTQFKDHIAKRDATVVRQLKAAGAILIGKSNVPPDLTDWQSDNPAYGRTRNPHNLDRSPGGSSGGAAAAVAAGMVPCEFGTDIGGSVRVPAHFCGVWGHKSSWGLISKHGHDHPAMAGKDAHDGALSIAGPIARNADDLEALMRITATLPLQANGKPLSECRILLVADQAVSPVDATVAGPMEEAVSALERAGVSIDRSSDMLPDLEAQHRDYMRMLGIAMVRGAPAADGKRANATDWFDLLDAQARSELAWAALFEAYDFVIAPPAPIAAFEHDDTPVRERKITINGEVRDFAEVFAWAGISTFPNQPSTVLPIGESGGANEKLPTGMQVIGPRWSDLDCIAIARAMGAILHR
ncbi:amidase family protein [Pontixanthobacter aestiaquae]|uniref:Amidase n=1 Tax=Pontixanthobacter aestiaquae TaxID=1509367 RepID=A0A844ZAP1_9SPHN|nr:amidase family protein [Pontixanthobacter aestiaquae]MDN3645060.1 amidase family protein [Pontixanthobacter aestiaquae]MXO83940.1 amidase [Pontixanthobacter aestiaquae]